MLRKNKETNNFGNSSPQVSVPLGKAFGEKKYTPLAKHILMAAPYVGKSPIERGMEGVRSFKIVTH